MVHGITPVAVLGSTGSIGQQTLDVLRAFPDRFNVIALAGGKNTRLLAAQAAEFHPQAVHFQQQKSTFPYTSTSLKGYQWLSLEEIASHPEVDMVVVATSGNAGLRPTLAAIQKGKRIALANKEVMVMAGELITSEAKKYGAEILPVDSEHSAIWQCLRGEQKDTMTRLILTASGGPFYHYSRDELTTVTAKEALKHPTWQMGEKVTIDSATLMNKGMEVIEAHWLFQMPFEQIQVVIHPQSIIHSMIEFTDGSLKAQLSPPDMHLPIQYALFYPERLPNPYLPPFDWESTHSLTLEKPRVDQFPCLGLAIEAGKRGSTYPTALSAADEVAVELFLSGRISFLDIVRLIEDALSHHQDTTEHPLMEDILAADAETREYARSWKP